MDIQASNLSTEHLSQLLKQFETELRQREDKVQESGASGSHDENVSPDTLTLSGYAMLGCEQSRNISDANANAMVRLVAEGHKALSSLEDEGPGGLWVLPATYDPNLADGDARDLDIDSTLGNPSPVVGGAASAAPLARAARPSTGWTNDTSLNLTSDAERPEDLLHRRANLGQMPLPVGLSDPDAYLDTLPREEEEVRTHLQCFPRRAIKCGTAVVLTSLSNTTT